MTTANLDLSGFPDVETLTRQATSCLMDVHTVGDTGQVDKDAAYSMCLAVQQHFEDVEFDDGARTVHDLYLAQATLFGLIGSVEAFACGAGQRDDLSWAALSLLKLALFLVSQELTELRTETKQGTPPTPVSSARNERQEATA